MTDADAPTTLGAGEAAPADAADRSMGAPDDDRTVVTAHESAPGRTVFTEADNVDAWIASDLTLDLIQ